MIERTIVGILAGVILFFIGATFGFESVKTAMAKDCDLLGHFRIEEQAYKCAKATKEQP